MSWSIHIYGHNSGEEYGTPEFREREQEIAEKAFEMDLVGLFKEYGASSAVFEGNFRRSDLVTGEGEWR